jgi:RNA polymerase sigma factor (sigma-70 family)
MMTFESIYKKYYKVVFNYLKSRIKDELVVEELASDAMIRVHKSLHTYNAELSKLNTWILNIAKNLMIDHFRKKTLNVIPLENVFVEWMNGDEETKLDRLTALRDSEMNPEEAMIEEEVRRRMYNQFESLNETEKLIASLHYFDGLSYDEIVDQLNMPLGTVKAKVHTARVRMMEAVPPHMRRLKTLEYASK